MLTLQNLVIQIGFRQLVLHLAHAGQHVEHTAHSAEPLHLLDLLAKIVKVERPLLHLVGDLLRFFGVDRLSGAFD